MVTIKSLRVGANLHAGRLLGVGESGMGRQPHIQWIRGDRDGPVELHPGVGHTLTIGAGNGGKGALVTDYLNPVFCGGDCPIIGGYATVTSGPEISGSAAGGAFAYNFGPGGSVNIWGEIPLLGLNTPSLLLHASFDVGTTVSGAGTVGSCLGALNLPSVVLNPALGTYKLIGASNDE